jgi:hypothetical protein
MWVLRARYGGAHDSPLVALPRGPTPPTAVLLRPRREEPDCPSASPTRPRRSHRRLLGGIALLVALGVAGTAVVGSATVRRQLLLSFTRQPDNFAELYFPSPNTLPTSFEPGRPLPVEFGLTNDSGSAQAYTYVVVAEARDHRTTIEKTGTMRLSANHSAYVPLRVTLPAGTTSLSVRLTDQPVVIRLLLRQGAADGR